jgi:hypothetical protein
MPDRAGEYFKHIEMKIFKYVLQTDRVNEIEMPSGYVIHAHEQSGKPCIWIQVENEDVKHIRRFVCMVTGVEFGANYSYIGTCHLENGKFVTHILEDI